MDVLHEGIQKNQKNNPQDSVIIIFDFVKNKKIGGEGLSK